MNRNFLLLLGVVVIVGIVSALFTYFRSEKMASQTDLATKGLAAIQKGNLIFYGLFMPIVVGLISFYIYRGLLARNPETAQTIFLGLAVGLGIALTILAAMVFKMRGFFEMTALHVLYVASFGWLAPLFWVR